MLTKLNSWNVEIKDITKPKPTDERPLTLPGVVYKIKSPKSSAAIYIAITRMNGSIREVFFYSRNNEIMLHLSLLGRLLSAIFRRNTNNEFLLDELRSLYDVNGGYFINGKYYTSIYSQIADILEGEIKTKDEGGEVLQSIDENIVVNQELLDTNEFSICPECNQKTLKMENGCMSCHSCGYSKCDH